MCAVSDNAKICTDDMVEALEGLIHEDANLALIYSNSAIAAALVLLKRYQIDRETMKTMFEEIWLPIGYPALEG